MILGYYFVCASNSLAQPDVSHHNTKRATHPLRRSNCTRLSYSGGLVFDVDEIHECRKTDSDD